VPLMAGADFGLASRAAVLSFLVSFGIVKALANLFAGRLSETVGRKRISIAGWLACLPVPFILIFAPNWGWVILANVLLGTNQGLCWSTTVIMKIDLVGPKRRGLAMGLNEFAGYLAVSLSALLTGLLAQRYGLHPVPFYPGVAFALIGLTLSVLFVHETLGHARHEARQMAPLAMAPSAMAPSPMDAGTNTVPAEQPSFAWVLLLTSWQDEALFAASQAGLVNNLNDGMVWGVNTDLPGRSRPAGVADRYYHGPLPRRLGIDPGLDRTAERPAGPQMADRGRDVGIGRRHLYTGRRAHLLGMGSGSRAAWSGYRVGVSYSAGGRLGRGAPRLAGQRGWRVPALARRRLRGGRNYGRGDCGCAGHARGHCRHRRTDLRVRYSRGRGHVRNLACPATRGPG
jgi:hypothetical protein